MSSKKMKMNYSEKNYHKLLAKKSKVQAQLEGIEERVNKAKEDYIVNGLLYYNEEHRNNIIAKAEDLCYSKGVIDRLKSISSEEWNPDSIDEEIISDFKSIEEYVKKYTPKMEKSFVSKLGTSVLGTNKERKE